MANKCWFLSTRFDPDLPEGEHLLTFFASEKHLARSLRELEWSVKDIKHLVEQGSYKDGNVYYRAGEFCVDNGESEYDVTGP